MDNLERRKDFLVRHPVWMAALLGFVWGALTGVAWVLVTGVENRVLTLALWLVCGLVLFGPAYVFVTRRQILRQRAAAG